MIPLASPTLFLYGPPATGKSTCAQNLAVALGKRALDLDTLVEQRLGQSIPAYVAEAGPEAFRDVETSVLENLCKSRPNAVVALGGGSLLRNNNRQMVETCGPVVCINTPIDILAKRVERKAGSRPFSKNADALRKTLEERQAHYASFPLTINVTGEQPPQEVWPRVMMTLGRYLVSGMGNPYLVTIAPNAIDELPRVLAKLEPKPRHVLLIGDSNTMPLYRNRVFKALETEIPSYTIPAGEENKTIQTITRLWEVMGETKIERNDIVIALGGGVVGDLTGFAAATWLRGIRWINLPTTLLSMVDAGIGGKTGADLPQGKNLIGAFHSPCAVLADTETLATLPKREIRCGLAESYKHAIIGDPELIPLLRDFAQGQTDIDALTRMVIRAVGVKVQTILKDPFEKTGQRAALNLGHTIGHAIEAASNFKLAHGEAVAIGTVAAAQLSERMMLTQPGLSDKIRNDLTHLGLPTEIPSTHTPEDYLNYLNRDKKKSAGFVRFALPIAFGQVKTGIVVPHEVLYEILAK
ncbi:MAG: 3-dehydroquinate synthase [bacterium]|nr:3-dehydroquinate synthase [bacterium]